MARSACIEPSASINLDAAQQSLLLNIARRSIVHGLEHGASYPVEREEASVVDIQVYGAFTTLTIAGELRGCMGDMNCAVPLAQTISEVSYAAAFQDPRFPPLRRGELDRVDIELSLLSNPEPLVADSKEELLENLEPGLDGLLLQDGHHRATFLPKVWEKLPQPDQFLAHLLAKAGLPEDYWSPTLRASRYRAFAFSE